MEQLKTLLFVTWLFVLFCIGFTFYAATSMALSAPSVKYEGGRYYLHKNGEQMEKYYNQDYTAKAAAANLSFECNCPITIEQPKITVTTIGGEEIAKPSLVASWSRPVERVDGTQLLEDEISHYLLEVNGTEIVVNGLQHTIDDLIPGIYSLRVATVLKDGGQSEFTEYGVITHE